MGGCVVLHWFCCGVRDHDRQCRKVIRILYSRQRPVKRRDLKGPVSSFIAGVIGLELQELICGYHKVFLIEFVCFESGTIPISGPGQRLATCRTKLDGQPAPETGCLQTDIKCSSAVRDHDSGVSLERPSHARSTVDRIECVDAPRNAAHEKLHHTKDVVWLAFLRSLLFLWKASPCQDGLINPTDNCLLILKLMFQESLVIHKRKNCCHSDRTSSSSGT
ncbi:hypothetical protein EDD37DRAFT_492409 [Exophiala viscosa]|uniref:uncharacterized protein n=1 Tax=Exophiala viscosa TaxID=2486360 RepID=UPI00218F50C6|nr:hypothetical protein EDD37DRAFT_492409 [Exophiala viscosa]